MPYVQCKTHGGAIAPHGCHHVAECISAQQSPGHTTFVDLDGFFAKGWVCDACLEALRCNGLDLVTARKEGFAGYPSEDEIAPLLDLLDFLPMCAKCFEELSRETLPRP